MTWDPDQYARFAAERRRPFDDLVQMLTPVPGGRAVDLGCGTGELTHDLHRHLQASQTLGIDNSEAMLERSKPAAGVRFELASLRDWTATPSVDVVFANASLQWVKDHPALLAHLKAQLAPGGQLAFQVPANYDHPSHTVAVEIAQELGLAQSGPVATVLLPETYATLLNDLGLVDLNVRMQVYGFTLPSTADIIEWTRGTLLTGYKAQLDADGYRHFEREYQERLLARLCHEGPYFYAFKRILAFARRR